MAGQGKTGFTTESESPKKKKRPGLIRGEIGGEGNVRSPHHKKGMGKRKERPQERKKGGKKAGEGENDGGKRKGKCAGEEGIGGLEKERRKMRGQWGRTGGTLRNEKKMEIGLQHRKKTGVISIVKGNARKEEMTRTKNKSTFYGKAE